MFQSVTIIHFLVAFCCFFWPKTVTLQAHFSESHYDRRVVSRKQTILPLTTNYQKGPFKPKIVQK